MIKRKINILYPALDFLCSLIAWVLFYLFRKVYIEPIRFGYTIPIEFTRNFYLAIVIIPTFWVLIYWLTSTYNDIYKKSRLREFFITIVITFIGTIILFFLFLLDDFVSSYQFYRFTFLALFLLQLIILSIHRITTLTIIKHWIRDKKIAFNTLLVGSNQKVVNLYNEFESEKHSQGYRFVGYVTVTDPPNDELSNHIPYLGSYNDLKTIIGGKNIENVILAIDTSEHKKLNEVISLIQDFNVTIKIIPDMYDIISGSVRMNYIFGSPLIDITPGLMPIWQQNLKRVIDISISLFVLIILSPLYLVIALGIKLSSKGSVMFRQTRMGKDRKPFTIYKFRTMYLNSESKGPMLSYDNDPRVTHFGKLLRKYRLDELIQFVNVLKGDMSIVGPRPERQYYIDKITKVAPNYHHLLKVKPGITSWGQVKFGYAENVEEMVKRMKYDILYIENMSLAMDFKIMFYTILTIIKGKGK